MPISRKEVGKLKPVTKDDLWKMSRKFEEEKKEAKKEYNRNYRQENKEERKEYNKEHAEAIKEYMKNWRRENKERIKEYHRTEKGKAIKRKSDVKVQTRRKRGLGFYPINEHFPGSHGHHFNKDGVIYIPAELHRIVRHNVFAGKNMREINRLAFNWLESVELAMPMESWMR